jgi:hypothetical protein
VIENNFRVFPYVYTQWQVSSRQMEESIEWIANDLPIILVDRSPQASQRTRQHLLCRYNNSEWQQRTEARLTGFWEITSCQQFVNLKGNNKTKERKTWKTHFLGKIYERQNKRSGQEGFFSIRFFIDYMLSGAFVFKQDKNRWLLIRSFTNTYSHRVVPEQISTPRKINGQCGNDNKWNFTFFVLCSFSRWFPFPLTERDII